MKTSWRKLGLLYQPMAGSPEPKLLTHAANPLPVHLANDTYRVFYSARDAQHRSSVGAVDIDIVKRQIIRPHMSPVFLHGEEGSYLADGVSIGNCYEADGKTYMLFMGWQVPKDKHWRGDIGRLLLSADLKLSLDTEAPILTMDEIDPISFSYPCVLKCRDGYYRMWYGSTQSWTSENGEMIHVINYAVSNDGHHWIKKGLAVPYQIGVAQAFSRPTVIEDDAGFHMWFSYRSGTGEKYRVGCATSLDGEAWVLKLKQQASLSESHSEWDVDMQAYPFVFDHEGARYMLYNGNGYGLTGFGLAMLVCE